MKMRHFGPDHSTPVNCLVVIGEDAKNQHEWEIS